MCKEWSFFQSQTEIKIREQFWELRKQEFSLVDQIFHWITIYILMLDYSALDVCLHWRTKFINWFHYLTTERCRRKFILEKNMYMRCIGLHSFLKSLASLCPPASMASQSSFCLMFTIKISNFVVILPCTSSHTEHHKIVFLSLLQRPSAVAFIQRHSSSTMKLFTIWECQRVPCQVIWNIVTLYEPWRGCHWNVLLWSHSSNKTT